MTLFTSKSVPDPTFEDLRSVIRQLHRSSERLNIGLHRSLHDDLGGFIVSAAMDLSAAARHLEAEGTAEPRLQRAQQSMMAALDLNRRLCEELRPSLLDNLGLFAALRWHLKHASANSSVICHEHYPDQEMRFKPEATTVLYRIARESLALIFAEPELKSVTIEVKAKHDVFELTLAHEHTGAEPVDLFGDQPKLMLALAERTRSLAGEMRVGRAMTATAMIHRFALGQII